MKVLILGGTGAMGVSLVEILAKQGHEVFVTSRRKRANREHIHYLQGDAHDLAWLESIMAGQEFAAMVDFMIYSSKQFAQRRDKLLAMANQYVFLSSSRVYSDSPNNPITEETPRLLDSTQDQEYLATDEYALAKAREENILRAGKRQNYTIIRPYITYNDERLQLGTMEKEAWLYRALQGRSIVIPKDMADSLTTLTYGYDVAEGIASILGKVEALGEAFHIVAPKPIKWQDVAKIYQNVLARVTGKRPSIKYLPDSQEFSRVFNNKYQVYCDRLYRRMFDSSKIERIGGKKDFVDIEEGLVMCLENFIRKGSPFHSINWVIEGWFDKQTGEKTSFSEMPSIKAKIKYILGRYCGFADSENVIRKIYLRVVQK